MLKKATLLMLPLSFISAENRDLVHKEGQIVQYIKDIDKKQELIDKLYNDTQKVFDKIESQVEEEEFDTLQKEIYTFCCQLTKDISLKNSVNISNFMKSEFKHKSGCASVEIKHLKYLVLRYTIEYIQLQEIIMSYQECLSEVINLRKK